MWFGSKVWHSNDKYRRVVYQCNNKFAGAKKCTTPHLTETEIKKAFVKVVNKLLEGKTDMLENIRLVREQMTVYSKEDISVTFKDRTEIHKS